jgi:hypothetical protein
MIDGVTRSAPTRLYLYHDLKRWVGQLVCRPGMEEYLGRDVLAEPPQPGTFRDIWDAPALRSFVGHDGHLFMNRPGTEERLMFSLNMDGFNPFQNKVAGKKASMGAMYMVCLNLPPGLRYKVENMFLVGIIPGPHHPSLDQINHILRPLVDDLNDFWQHGVYYRKTVLHPEGRLIRCALGPLVCDLPAARQMMGFASFKKTNHFCSYCQLTHEEIENFDYREWKPRCSEEYRQYAEEWRDANSEEDREVKFEANGVRWSELLRLTYWDPIKFTLLDSMHTVFLGDLRHHCRDVWGMDVKFSDGDGISFDEQIPATEEEMQEGHKVLRMGTEAQLRDLKPCVLQQLCHETQSLRFAGSPKKKKLVQNLLAFVCNSTFHLFKSVITDLFFFATFVAN